MAPIFYMFEEIIHFLSSLPYHYELKPSDWYGLDRLRKKLDYPSQLEFLKLMEAHTAIPADAIKSAFESLDHCLPGESTYQKVFSELDSVQGSVSQKIERFLSCAYFKQIALDPYQLTRKEWLFLIHRYEQQKRQMVTPAFFLYELSDMRKISLGDLLQSDWLKRSQPERGVKKVINYSDEEPVSHKRSYEYFKSESKENPFILDLATCTGDVDKGITDTGLRAAVLAPSSPVAHRNYPVVKKTPGGSKVRLGYQSKNYSLFQPPTPDSKRVGSNTIDFQSKPLERIKLDLPQLAYKKVEPISFVATLRSMEVREGQKRPCSQLFLTKASSSDLFRSYGVQITPEQNHKYHWSHLVAFFLGGPHAASHLVPSTATANYKVFHEIELFIQKLLTERDVGEVKIKVDPSYSGDCLLADMLVYSLNWVERGNAGEKECSETFYINPLSHEGYTKSMHETIDAIRESHLKI